jgi:hypothetical protein
MVMDRGCRGPERVLAANQAGTYHRGCVVF